MRPAWILVLVVTGLAGAVVCCGPTDAAVRHRPPGHHPRGTAGRPAWVPSAIRGREIRRADGPAGSRDVHAGVVPLANTTWDGAVMSRTVHAAILESARATNVDPDLLTAISWRESRFDPTARNLQSSALGLMQFTSETWLQEVKDFSAEHSSDAYLISMHSHASGIAAVNSRNGRGALLKLRYDPFLSAALAAGMIARQAAVAQTWIGRSATPTDLYLLHVLGRGGSARFLSAVAARPGASLLTLAGPRLLRNAGLLARDGRPMTIGSTYVAVAMMLQAQHVHWAAPEPKADGITPAQPPAMDAVEKP